MAKKAPRKRMNKRMRKAIRKSVSAMFMVTALLIAAIPVQDNVAAEDITPVYEDGIGSSKEPEPDPIPYEVGEDDIALSVSGGESVSGGDFDSWDDAYTIVDLGNGEYRLQTIFKVGSVGKWTVLTAFNQDYIMPSSGVLEIPTSVVTKYYQFDAETAAVKELIYTKSREYLQNQYNAYYPSNIIGEDSEGNPQYRIDIRKVPMDDPSQDVIDMALNVHACLHQGMTSPTDGKDVGCKAQKVVIPQAGENNKMIYIPFNSITKEFYYEYNRDIDAVANGAFSNDKEHGGQAYNGLGTEKDSITIDTLVLPSNLKAIGDYAFAGCSGIDSIRINSNNLTSIGNHAFEGCSSMTGIEITNLEKIGVEAFKGCAKLKSITLPKSLKEIGDGAFANCSELSTVDMSGVNESNIIGNFAFYNCYNISNFVFSNETIQMKNGVFALPSATKRTNGNWTDIVLGAKIKSLGKGIFDGRTDLKTVVLPDAFGQDESGFLDAGFFRQCKSLEWVKVYGVNVDFPENIFSSVTSDDFYVEGPATSDGSDDKNYADSEYYSTPRIRAHEAGINYKFTANGVTYFDVAENYQKKNSKGEVCWVDNETKIEYSSNDIIDLDIEIRNRLVPLMVTDYYLINAETGALEKYTPAKDNEWTEITIKGNYNGISVKSIAKGCFDDVRESATKLKIENDTITTIEKEAFKDFTKLRIVDIGNSVTSIEENAFAGCDALTDVYFRMDEVTIGNNAFSKNIGKDVAGLTFYGKIDREFAPFAWAMQAENNLNEVGLRVLYRSLPPDNLAAIYDLGASNENEDVVTLLYYPLYNYLDTDNVEYRLEKAEMYGLPIDYVNGETEYYSIIERNSRGTDGEVPDDQILPNGEKLTKQQYFADYEDIAYVEKTKDIIIPDGITSIDTKKFFNDDSDEKTSQKNSSNIIAYVQGDNGSKAAVMNASMHSDKGENEPSTAYSVPGLFSGYYEDYPEGSDEAKAYETEKKGNDRVESITMSTVTSIPNYAFDSCERLKYVDLGAACKKIGVAPFRGCTSLEKVEGNDTIICENDIIYTDNGDGTYTLVECLPSRGKDGNSEVSAANDERLALVSEISESAFIDCQYVITVNLKDCTKITKIPKNCFKGCIALNDVYLPSTVNYIEEGAFAGLKSIHVQIPAKEVYIHRDAFEHGENGKPLSTVVIESYEDSSAYRYTQDNYIGFTPYNEYECSVVFLNWDFEELYRTTVKLGMPVLSFITEKGDPTRSGYKFTGWKSLTSGSTLEAITADTTFVAQFDKSSGGGGGNGSSNTASGNNGSDSNNNGSSSDSSKLYTLTVVNGSGSGSYVKDANVIITANNPASGKKFKEWVVDTKNATLASTRVTATSFKMPAADVKVTAVYEDDNSSSSSNKNGSSVSGNSSTSSRYSTSGSTKVVITRPGISDTDLASAKVNGSKDGFIVKISETAEATAAVEEALINKYGSLDNLRYCAMDISLYDSTGTNKITDTTGYTVDITIPVPDSLREYAGNNKTAAVVNYQLEALSPKFTTIDGVPCVTFRATHFSPYTVYVDTQNLTAGGLDSTPKTGDGIHPKWFLSLGLACISVILFMKKDKKSPKVKVA